MGRDIRRDWDHYWQKAGDVPVFGQFTRHSQSLEAHWSAFFRRVLPDPGRTRVLDLACGSGAVTTVAANVAQTIDRPDIVNSCLDYSAAALSDLRKRIPQVRPVVSDVGAVPFANASFHVVASQFGLEYAGPAAFAEAARLVADGGIFGAICHLDTGPIHRECRDNLETIETVLDCRFLPLAKAAFRAHFGLARGLGTIREAEAAHKALAAATATVRTLIETKGPHAAAGTPARLHKDVTYMYNRRRNFEPQAVYDWIDAMTNELTAYAGRMRAMSAAALDSAALSDIRNILVSGGLAADEPSQLRLGTDAAPAAWILEARR